MYWYIAHVKSGFAAKLVSVLNRQENMEAFIPKTERWFRGREKGATYYETELYPDYVFIKSMLNQNDFDKKFKDFLITIKGLIEILNIDNLSALSYEETRLFEKLFNGGDIIKRTIGKKVDGKYKPTLGPLVGLESNIKKVNRHNRNATLEFEFLNNKLILPIEEVYL